MASATSTRVPQRLRALGILLLALLLGPVLAAGAHAAPKPAPSPAPVQRATFGIQPATAKGPDTRPYLLYPVAPGAQLDDHVAVVNYSRVPLTLRVYATDAYNGKDGSFSLLERSVRPRLAGTWIGVKTPKGDGFITVGPRSFEVLPIHLRVPANAAPGDHVAGVLAALTSRKNNAKGTAVELDQRVGVRTFARVNGPLKPKLSIENARFSYEQPANSLGRGRTHVEYTVHNTGNVTLGGAQRVRVHGLIGPTFEGVHLADLPALVPGGKQYVNTVIERTWPLVWMTGDIEISPAAVNGIDSGALQEYGATVHFFAVPWMPIALVIALIGLDHVRRRRRRGRSDGGNARRGKHSAPRGRRAAEPVPSGALQGSVARLAAAAVLLVLSAPAAAFADSEQVPYSDQAITGGLTLCGVDGKPKLSGKVSDKPFVWRVVGDSAADGVYRAPGRTAFLVAYQPREGIAPGGWSGYQLGAASTYETLAHPTVQMTPRASTLNEFLQRYTPKWDGYVQLRLLLSGSDRGVRRDHYDATDIRVVGDTWHVVRGGTADCSSGKGTSNSLRLHLPGAAGTPSPGAVASPPPLTTSPRPQVPGGVTPAATTSGVATVPAVEKAHGISGASLAPVLLAAGGAAGLAMVATVLVMRRRA